MVNAYAYCPRQFYLEYVDREWADNPDTLEGQVVHRRVDRPAGDVPPAAHLAEGARIHARSVEVGSQHLGAIAVIDLLEGDGLKVTPIDYKKGKPPPVVDGVWEADAVQICLQGLLRENGYECDGGVVYYNATREHVPVVFTPKLEQRTREHLAAARALASSPHAPAPLVNSPKCPRCSLVGICLPDEPLGARASSPAPALDQPRSSTPPETPVRRLLAPDDERRPLYVIGQGLRVGLEGEVLVVTEDGKRVDSIRLLDCSGVTLFGNAQISSQALRAVAAEDLAIAHLSYGGWLQAVTTPPPHKNVELRRRQYAMAASAAECLPVARAIVAGKIANCRTMLRRNARVVPEVTMRLLKALREKAEAADSAESLLGIEGSAARLYFEALPMAFRVEGEAPAFDFESRNRRPPRDPVNALLSFVYTLLVKDLVAALVVVGFDPFMGFYHRPRYGRPALALDLMEEFRPLVGDSVVLGLINRREASDDDFVLRAGGCAMSDALRRRVLDAYERRVQAEVTHPLFGYQVSYRRVFELQARLLARVLTGESPSYVAFRTR
jgi:CRISPR-associated protein Cas1